jgi:predicted nucleic acid-binding protein
VNALFVDTAGWMACADGADPAHARCCAARDHALEAGQTLITTDFVVDETLTLIRFRLGARAAETWWQQIDGSPRLRWERIDSARFDKARELFFKYRDKDFSFTDCTSFATMREVRLTHALTTDRHFRQMGFQLVPGPRGRSPRK